MQRVEHSWVMHLACQSKGKGRNRIFLQISIYVLLPSQLPGIRECNPDRCTDAWILTLACFSKAKRWQPKTIAKSILSNEKSIQFSFHSENLVRPSCFMLSTKRSCMPSSKYSGQLFEMFPFLMLLVLIVVFSHWQERHKSSGFPHTLMEVCLYSLM